ncbi:hypothetical protein ACFUIZ_35145 [Streptomyces cinereoruber]|uniref:hypothetical protein n=1 Tax=Streptomyces cinereoruber TaxID=67260 RepID=UPI00364165B7
MAAQWWRSTTNQPPKLIGTATFLAREEIKLNTKGAKGAEWLQQNTIAPLSIDGALGTVTLDYWDASCGGDTDCKREFVGPEFTGSASWATASSVAEQAVQCDEYAFASTKESGGATGVSNGGECLQAYARKGGDGKWRLYDDERPPYGGTPAYSEKCARASMHGGQNETAGRRLNGFYSTQRMLDNDPYFIDAPGITRP